MVLLGAAIGVAATLAFTVFQIGSKPMSPMYYGVPQREMADIAAQMGLPERLLEPHVATVRQERRDDLAFELPEALRCRCAGWCRPVDGGRLARVTRLNALLTSYLFLLWFDTRSGYQDTGPYALDDGRVLYDSRVIAEYLVVTMGIVMGKPLYVVATKPTRPALRPTSRPTATRC